MRVSLVFGGIAIGDQDAAGAVILGRNFLDHDLHRSRVLSQPLDERLGDVRHDAGLLVLRGGAGNADRDERHQASSPSAASPSAAGSSSNQCARAAMMISL